MFCSHCGIKVEGQPAFCPNCGEKLLQNEPAKKSFNWIKYLLIVGLLAFLLALFSYYGDSDPLEPVKGQLDALNDKKITEAYYGFTSLDFQKNTSLESFKELIKGNPILASIKSVDLVDKKVNDDTMVLTVLLSPEGKDPFTMEYNLSKEEDGWRIDGFRKIANLPAVETADKKALDAASSSSAAAITDKALPEDQGEAIVRKQLTLIKGNSIKAAFNDTVIPDDKTITLEQFQAFIEANPLLTRYESLKFERAEPFENLLVIPVTLISKNEEAHLEYTLEGTKAGLKIKGIEVFPNDKFVANKTNDFEIEQTLVSLKATPRGDVIDPQTTFKDAKGPIYINLVIANVKQGEIVEAVLENSEQMIKSPPIEHTIQDSGELYVAFFTFNPSSEFWPKGTYNLHSRLKNDNQNISTSTFKIE